MRFRRRGRSDQSGRRGEGRGGKERKTLASADGKARIGGAEKSGREWGGARGRSSGETLNRVLEGRRKKKKEGEGVVEAGRDLSEK